MAKINKEQLLEEVKSYGYEINTIDDLKKIGSKDKRLIPLLLDKIRDSDDVSDKEFLIRCLGVKGFNEVIPAIMQEYRRTENQFLKWAIGNTVYLIEDRNVIPDVIEIVKDKKNGMSRQMFILYLGKTRDEKALPVLKELLHDNEVAAHTIRALSEYKMPELVSILEPFTKHKSTLIRKESQRAIKKLQSLTSK